MTKNQKIVPIQRAQTIFPSRTLYGAHLRGSHSKFNISSFGALNMINLTTVNRYAEQVYRHIQIFRLARISRKTYNTYEIDK